MIGIDTNILVRYLAQDDPFQSASATRIIERTLTGDQPGFISLVAIAETVWVLRKRYGMSDSAVAQVLRRLLHTDALVLQNEREVFLATEALEAGTGAFDDALIAALGRWAGCSRTLTFDRKAARLSDFQLA